MKLDPALLDLLVCPDCRGALAVDEDASELVCTACGLAYQIGRASCRERVYVLV